MRRRSFTGPLLLLVIGGLFLWRNLHPEVPVFDIMAQYWPFLLIAWGLMRLVEVVLFRSQRWSSFSGGEVFLVVLICLAGSGVWEAHRHGIRFHTNSLAVFGEQYDYPVSATASPAGMTRLTIENDRGSVKIIGADTKDITITGHKVIRAWNRSDADRTNGNTPVEIVPQGDRMLVRTNQDRVPENQRISDDLEITVPRGMALEARGGTADYDVADMAADVELTADRADVRLARVGGDVRVNIGRSDLIRASAIKGKLDVQGSRGSDLDLENIAGQVTITGSYMGTVEFKNLAKPLQFEGARNTELHVEAVPGRISMDLSEVSASGLVGPVRLITQSRDIKLEQFTKSLELETQRGDVALQPALPMPSIEARSGIGRIELVVPEKATFDLQATAERGEAINDFGPAIQKETEGRSASLKGRVGEGPTVRLTAARGSVSVRKEGTEPSEVPDSPTPKTPKMPKMPKVPGTVDM